MDNNNNENCISLEWTIEYLQISSDILNSWIKVPKNEVPIHKVGRFWHFQYSEIGRWVQSEKNAIRAQMPKDKKHIYQSYNGLRKEHTYG